MLHKEVRPYQGFALGPESSGLPQTSRKHIEYIFTGAKCVCANHSYSTEGKYLRIDMKLLKASDDL